MTGLPRPQHEFPEAPRRAERGSAINAVLLIHGGLWDDMDAERFWTRPGIDAGLQRCGFEVLAPNRRPRARHWAAEVDHLTLALPRQPVDVVAGSNGCTVAVRLALAFPDRVRRLVLAWPATAGDPVVDSRTRSELITLGATAETVDSLLAGQTLRGVTDSQLATITTLVGVLPATPANLHHQQQTTDALHDLLQSAVVLPGGPEPPRPDFPPHLQSFLDAVAGLLRSC